MEVRGLGRCFVVLSSLLMLGGPLSAATPELDPLAAAVDAYLASPAPDGRGSLELAVRIGWSARTASFEPDPGKRSELLARLAALRGELQRLAGGDKANGSFSGRVTDDGAPLDDAVVWVFTLDGYNTATARTGADGRYSLSVPPGTYVLYLEPPYGSHLSPQLYAGKSCFLSVTCELSDGTALTVASGGHRSADFALADLGRIAGRVRRGDTQEPVRTQVRAYRHDGSFLTSASSADGTYELGGLPPGDYWVVADGQDGLAGMIFDGISCNPGRFTSALRCKVAAATAVRVELDGQVSGIDFDLPVGGVIAGRVFDAHSGGPPTSTGRLVLWDEAGREVHDDAYVDPQGFYRIEGLASGTYFASFDSFFYTSQFFDRADCFSGAASGHLTGEACLPAARPIAVALGAVHGPIDFPLRDRGTLFGHVRDDLNGSGIAGAEIALIDPASGTVFQTGATDSSGFFSISDVPAVRLQLLVSHQHYLAEYFDDVDAGEGPAAAEILEIEPAQTTSIEIGLAPRGAVRARVLAAESGEPVGCPSLRAIRLDGSESDITTSECGGDGWLTLKGIRPGDHYIMVGGSNRAAFLHGRGSCTVLHETSRCHLERGAVVQVRGGETVELGTVLLEGDGEIQWRVRQAGQASLSPGVRLRLFDSLGDQVRTLLADEDDDFGRFSSLAPGDYRLVAEGGAHWQSFAYPDAPCSQWYCDPRRGEAIEVPPGFFGPWVTLDLAPLSPYAGCAAGDTALCLNQGRYRVSATWRDFAGASGAGAARALTPDSGYFYFFSPNNLEVLVKVLNGCEPRLGHRFWVFGAGLTNVQVELRVEDTLTGASRLYSNALGTTFQPILDSGAFATCDAEVPPPATAAPPQAAVPAPPAADGSENCQETPGSLCLAGRFAVEASYRTAQGNDGSGTGTRVTADTGTFYFFDPANVELVVKVLDACGTALPRYWVFASGLTDVAVDLQITDRASGRSKTYQQPLGPFAPILDLTSFPCD